MPPDVQHANEIGGEGVLEEGALVIRLQRYRSGFTGERIDDVLPMLFGPLVSLGAASRIEPVGGGHDVLLEPDVVAAGALFLFFDGPVDATVGLVDGTTRLAVGR